MEIMSYISSSDWFTHYMLSPTMWVPFLLWLLLVGWSISLIYLVLKKMMW